MLPARNNGVNPPGKVGGRMKGKSMPSHLAVPNRILCAALAIVAIVGAAQSAPAALGIRKMTCAVPMRDGTRLTTDIYLPRVSRRAVPVVLVRTPYGREQIPKPAARLVCCAGRALVVQDMRRRIPSDPELAQQYAAWAAESRDGHDAIGWIARQPWCDGNIATWGPSALGITQNLLAPDAPSCLKAQYVMFAAANIYTQAVYQGGVFRQELVEGWTRRAGYQDSLPILRQHYKYDDYWSRLNAEEQAERVNAPAVFVGGWHDAFLQGTINAFVNIQSRGGPRARGNCRLIIGPWIHDDAEQLADPRNARRMPEAANPFRFLDYWIRCVRNGVPCDSPVHYYVMGAHCEPGAPGNYWRCADGWPPPAEATPFYLHASGELSQEPPSADGGQLSYRYDPLDPVPTEGGQNIYIRQGSRDQRSVESRPDVLCFTSAPLAAPLEITGPLSANLYVSSDCPDTDFTVKLTDVYPDGRSMLLADGILRARFRESLEQEEFLEPGRIYPLTVDLWSTSYVFNRGHCIRVAVSSSNAPRFEPNPNTGAPSLDGGPTRIATNSVHVSRLRCSHILLPVCRIGQ